MAEKTSLSPQAQLRFEMRRERKIVLVVLTLMSGIVGGAALAILRPKPFLPAFAAGIAIGTSLIVVRWLKSTPKKPPYSSSGIDWLSWKIAGATTCAGQALVAAAALTLAGSLIFIPRSRVWAMAGAGVLLGEALPYEVKSTTELSLEFAKEGGQAAFTFCKALPSILPEYWTLVKGAFGR